MLTRLARVVMALSAVVLMAHSSWAAEGVRVTAERANLRSKPSTESEIVAKVAKGAILPVLGREGGWVSQPAASQSAATSSSSRSPSTSSHGKPGAEPFQFGAHLDFASSSIGFGFGIRASSGIPVVPHLGVLGVFDFYLGAQAIANPSGVEVAASGHSLQFGLYPTYSHEFGNLRVYGGAGLSILGTSYTIPGPSLPTPGAPPGEVSGSQWDTSLGLVAGVKYEERFFGELRYQFGGGSHVTLSAGVVFGK